MFIGVIVTPIVGLIGAVGGSAGGALLATILHYIEFSNFDKEYKLSTIVGKFKFKRKVIAIFTLY